MQANIKFKCPYCKKEHHCSEGGLFNGNVLRTGNETKTLFRCSTDEGGCDKSFAIHVDLVPTINTSLIHYEEHEQQHRP